MLKDSTDHRKLQLVHVNDSQAQLPETPKHRDTPDEQVAPLTRNRSF